MLRLQPAGLTASDVTTQDDMDAFASHPYLATQALLDAGYMYVHHPGAACTDNVGHVTGGNITFVNANVSFTVTADFVISSDTNAILYNSGGVGAYDIDLQSIVREQASFGRKSFTLTGSLPVGTTDLTMLELGGKGILGCAEYEDVFFISNENMGEAKVAKLASAITASKNYLTKASAFFKDTATCRPGASAPSGTMITNSIDMTNYCEASALFTNTPYAGETLLSKGR